MALWLRDTFGGNIKVLQENDKLLGIKNPDYNWNNKLWELKTCSTLSSIDTRLKKGIRQLRNKENKGGIIIYINNFTNSKEEILFIIRKRLLHSLNLNLKIIVIINNNIEEIFVVKERKSITKAHSVPR